MDDLQWKTIGIRMDAVDRRQEASQGQLDRMSQDVAELVDILHSWKGAMKVLEFMGKIAKPIGAIAGAVTAVWALLHFGGPK